MNHGEKKKFCFLDKKRFVNIASADYHSALITATTLRVTETTHIVVSTIETVTTTITVC